MTRPGPVLALMPGTRKAPGTGANTGPYIHPELGDERVFAGLHYAGYDAWLDHIWTASTCARPIRLRGDIKHIDAATGELLRTSVPRSACRTGPSTRHAGTGAPPPAPAAPRPTAATPTTSSAPGSSAAKASPRTSPGTRPCSSPLPPRRSARSTPGRSASTPATTRRAAAASRNPATPAATRPPASTAALPHASPGTSVTMPGSASRCARTATTTRLTSCGTTRPANCGGVPSKPSNATSASSAAAVEYRRSGFPAATANTA